MSDSASDLHLDVWQFVRLMVQMEESLKGAGGARVGGTRGGAGLKALYDLWEDLWVDLDAQLLDMGKRDPDAFADMMMDQEVVLENPPAGARVIVADELTKVVDALKRQLARTDDPVQVEDLSFERDELSETIRELRGHKGAPRNGPRADTRADTRGTAGKKPAVRPGDAKASVRKGPPRRQPRQKGPGGKGPKKR